MKSLWTSIFILIQLLVAPVVLAQSRPAPPQQFILPPHFTLQFDLTEQDVSSPAMRQSLTDYEHKTHLELVKEEKITPQQAADHDKGMAEAMSQVPDRHLKVVFSGNQNRLYYSTEEESVEESVKHVIVYNGDFAWEYTKNDAASGFMILWPGLGVFTTGVLPLPGAGTQSLPLIRFGTDSTGVIPFRILGETPVFDRGHSAELPFLPSEALVKSLHGRAQIMNCILPDRDNTIEQRWDFSRYQDFANTIIAAEIRFTDYQTFFVGQQSRREPFKRLTYRLQSASIRSLPDKDFDAKTWLKDQDAIQDNRHEGKVISFIYRPKRGGLDEQEERARLEQDRQKAEIASGKIKGNAVSGFFALAATTCFLIFWHMRRRFRTAN